MSTSSNGEQRSRSLRQWQAEIELASHVSYYPPFYLLSNFATRLSISFISGQNR